MDVRIEQSWKEALGAEFDKAYFASIVDFLHKEKAAGKIIYPKGPDIFKAFDLCPLPDVKAVILGQDPYHRPFEAMGLSFSVPNGVTMPPSLRNIFREISDDCGITMSGNTDLTPWARQGVLMLNSILTVENGLAASHSGIGWQQFTDAVISCVSERCDAVVFMLWGNYAKGKCPLIDAQRHCILEAAHPSPLAGGAFFGCKHFSKANTWLSLHGKTEIDWKI